MSSPSSGVVSGGVDSSQLNQPDDHAPTLTRQAELQAAYEANVAENKAPYAAVEIRTRGELLWIMREQGWSGEDTHFGVDQVPRANLSGANFKGVNLGAVHLFRATMRGAIMDNVRLEGAQLKRVDLTGAHLWTAHLHGADLYRANLSGAHLWTADLSDARLDHANLAGAHLQETDLRSADLRWSRMDSESDLQWVTLDRSTALCDVAWNGAQLTQINWERAPRLGDERRDIKWVEVREFADEKAGRASLVTSTARGFQQRILAKRNAARAYRGLSIALQHQGLLKPASHYRLEEQRLERKASFWEGRLHSWLFSWLLNFMAGYGELPVRSFLAYIFVIVGCAAAYFTLGPGEGHAFSVQGAFVFSVTSFHGRGFFPGALGLDDSLTLLAAIEAIMGLFIEITFIATFTRRFFAR